MAPAFRFSSTAALTLTYFFATLIHLALSELPVRHTFDLSVRYFTDASMTCDHPSLNLTLSDDIASISWVLPDGALVGADTVLNPSMYVFTPTGFEPVFSTYNLTALQVDDPSFGFYTCVVVYTTPGKTPSVVRWGLNVNGADFTDLMETYQTNAIIGGSAAAAMLLIVGGGCLIWNVRNSRRSDEKDEGEGEDEGEVGEVTKEKFLEHSNQAYAEDGEMLSVEVHVENGGGDISVKM
ncbi:uncharacterized protein LOC131942320 [Physella acuta]|uniref:uncharacterized protein LOC131942320 n=1 Tax=Physella acuta TaxID=109671 RepID=UPI0027DDA297|nr:uncharacterized protein LOC131942320 [Physella acuta]XP_059158114.1 uncharacterized protein LOC131942320 [Physella acuta]XP_059158116.1 uncharacterized protein LOC131942320 [Physella acuta]XP_059158117.1 uncharacterized protein LOC131942320 [Physella acuta]